MASLTSDRARVTALLISLMACQTRVFRHDVSQARQVESVLGKGCAVLVWALLPGATPSRTPSACATAHTTRNRPLHSSSESRTSHQGGSPVQQELGITRAKYAVKAVHAQGLCRRGSEAAASSTALS